MQPLVENSFVHGLENKVENGKLVISGTLSTQGIKIRIIDNGIGIEQGKVAELLNIDGEIQQYNGRGTGHGLKNVQKRIQMMFGEEYGLTIRSSLSTGTIVEILLPVMESDIDELKRTYKVGS